jgi:DNA repair exonuclease SbcCD ATPase subunit
MSQEKYSKYYVELLTSTLNDQVLQNISLKAREKVNSEIFEEVSKGYETLTVENESFKNEKEKSLSEKEVAKNAEIESLKKQISDLQSSKSVEIERIQSSKSVEIESLKKQISDLQSSKNVEIERIQSSKSVEIERIQSSKNAEVERLKQQVGLSQTSKNNEIDDIKRRNSEQLQQIQSTKNGEIEQLNKVINGLRDEVNKAALIKSEYDKLKHQLNHMDTFRTQLADVQKQVEEKNTIIDDLNSQIENLKSVPATPVKRKKSNVEKVNTVQPESTFFAEETRDGGSF